MMKKQQQASHYWLFDSRSNSRRSPWLQSTLAGTLSVLDFLFVVLDQVILGFLDVVVEQGCDFLPLMCVFELMRFESWDFFGFCGGEWGTRVTICVKFGAFR